LMRQRDSGVGAIPGQILFPGDLTHVTERSGTICHASQKTISETNQFLSDEIKVKRGHGLEGSSPRTIPST